MTVSLRRIRRHWFLFALAAVLFVLLTPIQAQAAFRVSVATSTTVGTGSLSPVSGATVSQSKCGALLGQAYLVVSWTATPSTFASGYRVTALAGSTPQTPVLVSGRNTTSADVPVTRGLLITNPYTFRIEAVYGKWTSPVLTTSQAINCPL